MLRRLRQYIELPRSDRIALAAAVALVTAVRLSLCLAPFRRVASFAGRRPGRISPALARLRPARLSWAVQAASKRIPGATCLTQALSLQILLMRAGRASEVRIGVARDSDRGMKAHAWLTHEGEVLIGGDGGVERFAPILALAPTGGVAKLTEEHA